MKTVSYIRISGLFILMLLFLNIGQAQMESSSELYRTVLKLDSILFEDGFNNCKLKEMDHLIAPDLEFYHDQSGISTSKEEFFKAIEQNICGSGDKKPIRKLVVESMEVYPLYNNGILYGAIQNGVHEFYIKEAHKELYITGIAKFSHVFILQDNNWQLKRVLSYDHRSPEE